MNGNNIINEVLTIRSLLFYLVWQSVCHHTKYYLFKLRFISLLIEFEFQRDDSEIHAICWFCKFNLNAAASETSS